MRFHCANGLVELRSCAASEVTFVLQKMHFVSSSARFSLRLLFTQYKTVWLTAISSHCLAALCLRSTVTCGKTPTAATWTVLPLCYEEKSQNLPWKKKPENNNKPQTYKMFKRSQNQTLKARYRCLHIKIEVICIICIMFLTSSSLLTPQFTSRLAANQMYEVTSKKLVRSFLKKI